MKLSKANISKTLFFSGLSCLTEHSSVMPTPHRKLKNGSKFSSGSWLVKNALCVSSLTLIYRFS